MTVLLFLVAAGCAETHGPPPDPSPLDLDPGCDDVACERTLIVSSLEVPEYLHDPDVVSGLDLDRRVSDELDPSGCQHGDAVSPPPEMVPGIDNQFASLASAIGAAFGFPEAIRDGVLAGELIIVLRMEGVDDPVEDDLVHVTVLEGRMPRDPMTGEPLTAVLDGGELAAAQTFDIAASSFDPEMVPLARMAGRLTGGRLEARGADLRIRAALESRPFELVIRGSELHAELSEAGLRNGVWGGRLRVEESIGAFAAGLDLDESVVTAALRGTADLEPRGGDCDALSIGFLVETRPAVLGEIVSSP